ncbi:hypothetical protein EGR_05699 [Echinococcus granulosus]|uniref:Uncharacterized protein n=1 Tax=Echinococcus granulosus TaxID=6210 RepID=W6UEH4_ECHGR|nr:hypothetical protein EGR_05699 [Echinococcus granulosus]EUB59448.1 hypothetical protein EGR_05699 [Echinococcus granulosus]
MRQKNSPMQCLRQFRPQSGYAVLTDSVTLMICESFSVCDDSIYQPQCLPPDRPSPLRGLSNDVMRFVRANEWLARTKCHTTTTWHPPPLQPGDPTMGTHSNTIIYSIERGQQALTIAAPYHAEANHMNEWRRLACTSILAMTNSPDVFI